MYIVESVHLSGEVVIFKSRLEECECCGSHNGCMVLSHDRERYTHYEVSLSLSSRALGDEIKLLGGTACPGSSNPG